VSRLDKELFVGRGRELATFRNWLTQDAQLPEILNVSGPSGVGKSTLLRAFKRIAVDQGRRVVHADVGTFPATARALVGAANGSRSDRLRDVAARLSKTRALVLLDRFDELGELTDYLQSELLPGLDTRVRVVIAGRYPVGLAWSRSELWHTLIRPLRLEGYSAAETHEYLHRRGLTEPGLVRQVVDAAGNNPLALSLAADLALRFGVRDFGSAPEWRLVVRSLVERLLVEVRDPRLRELLEGCAAVRQFDEATLAAVSGCDDVSAAFGQLCQLSFVSPAEHGLMLHDDVRRRLAEDLAWRHPDRCIALRARALAYYRERVGLAPPHDREWLVADRFYLWGNALIQRLFFSSNEPGRVWVQAGRPADYVDIRRLFATRMEYLVASDLAVDRLAQPKEDGDFLEAILRYPGTRLRVAHNRDGRTLGFSTVLPVCRETVPLLDFHSAFAPLVHAYWSPADLAALPASSDDATIFFLLHLVYAGEMSGAIRAALLRDLSSVFASSGIYLSSTFVPANKRMLEACGFERLPTARNEAWGAHYPVDGYVLDLSRIGFEPWIEALMSGRRPPRPLGCTDLEHELQDALRHWTDDGWLARSRLAELPSVPPAAGEAQRSSAVRQAILQALATARAQATAGLDAAYHAVELAYLARRPSRKLEARNLAVSRATLYRLIQRGIHGLAEALSRPTS
jgi:energy-coupling factor transporter ATP-binding protein EcfA2